MEHNAEIRLLDHDDLGTRATTLSAVQISAKQSHR